jgi:hypothetical protein
MELSFQLYEEAYISISQGGSYFAYWTHKYAGQEEYKKTKET